MRRLPFKPRSRIQRGMMMLEVLIALVIFSVGILGMVAMQSVSSANSINSEDRTIAAMLANLGRRRATRGTGRLRHTAYGLDSQGRQFAAGWSRSAHYVGQHSPYYDHLDAQPKYRQRQLCSSQVRNLGDHPVIPRASYSRRHTHGHTLIELMIAIAIGVILVLAAFQVMATFEGHKRTTTAMNDSMQAANFGLYQLDLLTRSGGTGLTQVRKYATGCLPSYTPGAGSAVTNGVVSLPDIFGGIVGTTTLPLRLAPAVIFPGTATDAVMLMSGGAGFGEVPVKFTTAAAGSQLQLDNTIGFFPGDWVLVSGNAANPTTAGACLITQVASTYAAETAENSLGNVALPLRDASVGSVTLASFGANALVTDLGSGTNASFLLYGVDGTQFALESVDLLNAPATVQRVADDVVLLRAVYGTNASANGYGALTWVNPAGDYAPANLLDGSSAAATRLAGIKAIRVAIIVRSALPERWDASDQAIGTGTAASNQINNGTYPIFAALNSTAVATAWIVPGTATNYRYREVEATIPLRNAYYSN